MFCPHCGTKTGDGADFCTNCGYSFSNRAKKNIPESEKNDNVFAPVPPDSNNASGESAGEHNGSNIQSTLNDTHLYGTANGTEHPAGGERNGGDVPVGGAIAGESQFGDSPLPPKNDKKKSTLPIIIIIIIILIAGIAVGVCFALGVFDGNSSSDEEDPESFLESVDSLDVYSESDESRDTEESLDDESSNTEEILGEAKNYNVPEEVKTLASYKAIENFDASNGFAVTMDAYGTNEYACVTQKFMNGNELSEFYSSDGTNEIINLSIIKDGYQYVFDNDTKKYKKTYLGEYVHATHPVEYLFMEATYYKTETVVYEGKTYTVDYIKQSDVDVALYVNSEGKLKYVENSGVVMNIFISANVTENDFKIPSGYVEEGSADDTTSNDTSVTEPADDIKALASYKAIKDFDASKGFKYTVAYSDSSVSVSIETAYMGNKLYQKQSMSMGGETSETVIIVKDDTQYQLDPTAKTYIPMPLNGDTSYVCAHPVDAVFADATYKETKTAEYNGETYTVDVIVQSDIEVGLYVSPAGELKYMENSGIVMDVIFDKDVTDSLFDIPSDYTLASDVG